jgi:hypothetical protein
MTPTKSRWPTSETPRHAPHFACIRLLHNPLQAVMPGTRNTRATVHDRCLQRCCSFLVKCEGADSRVRISQTVRDQRKSQCSVHCQAAQSSETVEISVDKSLAEPRGITRPSLQARRLFPLRA